ncbi:MAG: flagellar basal-body rod protein FlgG [Parvularculaceae bacterium]
MESLRIAASGMAAQQKRVAVISNNISNMSTTAYAPRSVEFADLHYQQVLRPGTISSQTGTVVPAGIQLGTGVRLSAVTMSLEQGGLRESNGDLDLAIEGRGFFEITLPSGEAGYTRDGNFNRNAEGEMVTSEGYPLADGIVIPDDALQVSINQDGEVYAYFSNAVAAQQVGTIGLTVFSNPTGLEALGGNLYKATEASGSPVIGAPGQNGVGNMRQGFLEESGVDVVNEISDLIEAQRGYELNSKVITASDEMLSTMVRMR